MHQGFLDDAVVKNPPSRQEMEETGVWSLGQEDTLEKEMAPHSSILAWKIPRTEEPSGLQSMGSQRVRHAWTHTHTHTHTHTTYRYYLFWNFSSVQPLSCPSLCDPMDCSTPGFPVHHQLPELAQTHVHRVGDAIQPSHPLLSSSPPAFNLS